MRVEDAISELARDPDFAAAVEKLREVKAISSHVLRYRSEHNLTQSQFAKLARVEQASMSKIENLYDRNLTLDTMRKIARAMGTTVAALLVEPAVVKVERVAESGAPAARGGSAYDDALDEMQRVAFPLSIENNRPEAPVRGRTPVRVRVVVNTNSVRSPRNESVGPFKTSSIGGKRLTSDH